MKSRSSSGKQKQPCARLKISMDSRAFTSVYYKWFVHWIAWLMSFHTASQQQLINIHKAYTEVISEKHWGVKTCQCISAVTLGNNVERASIKCTQNRNIIYKTAPKLSFSLKGDCSPFNVTVYGIFYFSLYISHFDLLAPWDDDYFKLKPAHVTSIIMQVSCYYLSYPNIKKTLTQTSLRRWERNTD